ncbi:MAG TPA: hypothetical protein VMF09_08615 [Solirubrobacteraceae bacterium]|nr:hypothetical protein [Solirubrobacteraceae bacterium]
MHHKWPLHDVDPERVVLAWEERLSGLGIPDSPRSMGPLVVKPSLYRELYAATRALLGLLRRAVEHAGAEDRARTFALGADPRDYPFFPDRAGASCLADCCGRPDLVTAHGRPRFLEINVGSCVGGAVETQALQELWSEIYEDRMGLSQDSPFDAIAALITDAVDRHPGGGEAVILGTVQDVMPADARYFRSMVTALAQRGCRARWCELELTDSLYAGESQPAAAWCQFTVQEARRNAIDLSPVHRLKERGCELITPQIAALLDNKKVLAWLSEGRDWMSRADRVLVARYVPWTRVLQPGRTAVGGSLLDIREHVLSHRTELVIKRAVSMQGEDVRLGREVDGSTWQYVVEEALQKRDSIVQAYVEPDRYDMCTSENAGPCTFASVAVVFSPFVIDGRPAGCMVRYHPEGRYGVVNVDNFGALLNVAMTKRHPLTTSWE